VLPWIILAAGLVLAGLAAALGLSAARRAKAQGELDRIFNLSTDLIAVADFQGHFTRVNPAVEQILGYTQEEFLAKPYLELVHLDDRGNTGAEAAAIADGKATLSFENRYVRKDGSYRVLEWTSTPVIEDGAMYGVGRDVTERRRAETEVARLADEQASLRRVATLVAQGAPAEALFTVVAQQVAEVLGVPQVSIVRYHSDGTATERGSVGPQRSVFEIGRRWVLQGDSVVAQIRDSSRPARIDDYTALTGEIAGTVREAGIRSAVGIPILVAGRLWGAMVVSSTDPEPLPSDIEGRLTDFTELVATAIANSESREALRRLADEQAALRRVATLVAEDVPSSELFGAVAREVGVLLGGDFAAMARFEDNGVFTVATWAAVGEHPPVPERWEMQEGDPATTIAETRRATRWTDWSDVPGPIAAFIRELGIRCTVGTPIVVEGRLWGALALHSKQSAPLPPETEARMAGFTDLVGTAVANAEARTESRLLTDEQAALRHVATLVAREASQADTFNAIAEELAGLVGAQEMRMMRYEGDSEAVVVATSGRASVFGVGEYVPLYGQSAASIVLRTSRPARIDAYETVPGPIAEAVRAVGVRSVVGAPIVVEGRLWGAMIAAAYEEPLPTDAEFRLSQFTELMAVAIANTETRAEVERLADEQAALRRVATLVAQGASADVVLDAVAAEMERLLDADAVAVGRYESREEVTVVAHHSPKAQLAPVGTRLNYQGHNISELVRQSGRPARMEDLSEARGGFADVFRLLGSRALVGTPIVVQGTLWGTIVAGWNSETPPPANTEERMARFADLLKTAIANADSREQLVGSRARLVTEADHVRRQVVRDLHDGAQQRLVHTIVTLKLARRALRKGNGKMDVLVAEALEHAEQGNAELRELAHGILPAVLTRGGLRAGANTVVERLDLPVQVEIPAQRFVAEIEASAYFVVAEALTNVVKHSHAKSAEVRATVDDGSLIVEVQDDGIGGADAGGHGLVGMNDRVTALGGHLEIESPAGGGTRLSATLPLSAG
jgi:PAS domain S-box-containing protein